MRTGRQTLASIEEALGDIAREERELRGKLEKLNRARATLAAERVASLKDLARHRVHEAIADGVIDDADRLSASVRSVLSTRTRKFAALKRSNTAAEHKRVDLVQKLDALNMKITGLEEKLDRFAEAARATLSTNPEYATLQSHYQELSSMLERASARAEQVMEEEREKSEPYRNDPLFMYLWRRGFGTSEYEAIGIIRHLDKWVARLIKYSDARSNYFMLTEIPRRLKYHAERLKERTREAKEELGVREADKTRELAGENVINEIKEARELQTKMITEFEAVSEKISKVSEELNGYAEGKDELLQEAIRLSADFLNSESIRDLASNAEMTAGLRDDQLVERIRSLRDKSQTFEKRIESGRQRLDELYEKKRELIEVSANFRHERYDDIGSEFTNNPDLQELLNLFSLT